MESSSYIRFKANISKEIIMKVCVYVEGKSSPSLIEGTADLEQIESSKIQDLPSAVYDSIELIDVLEFDERPDILEIALSKLRHGGTIKIAGTEAVQIIRMFHVGAIPIEEASGLLLNGRFKMTSAHNLNRKLESHGLEIKFLTISGTRYLAEAIRK